jgi:hypothetical protein
LAKRDEKTAQKFWMVFRQPSIELRLTLGLKSFVTLTLKFKHIVTLSLSKCDEKTA